MSTKNAGRVSSRPVSVKLLCEKLHSTTCEAEFQEVFEQLDRNRLGFVINNSPKSVYIKSEVSSEVIEVPANSYLVKAFDGIATWNASEGKVQKCRDVLNYAFVRSDGLVLCPFKKRLDGPPDTHWDQLFNKASEIQASGGGSRPPRPERRERPNYEHSTVFVGDINIHPRIEGIA